MKALIDTVRCDNNIIMIFDLQQVKRERDSLHMQVPGTPVSGECESQYVCVYKDNFQQ